MAVRVSSIGSEEGESFRLLEGDVVKAMQALFPFGNKATKLGWCKLRRDVGR